MSSVRWSKKQLEDYQKSNPQLSITLTNAGQKPKPAKYKNDRIEYDGHTFASKKECNRYKELLLMMKGGAIGQLGLQVPYELNEGGTHSLKYIADFVYVDALTGKEVVEDTKGFLTVEYKKKRKLMLQVHGIAIKEV